MNRREDKEVQSNIEVMQAYLGGYKIQYREVDGINQPWASAGTPLWDFKRYEYRVKREPRVFWVAEYGEDTFDGLFNNREAASKTRSDLAVTPTRVFKVVEVIE